MYTKRLLILFFCSMLLFKSHAQQVETVAEADVHSLNLFNAAQWKPLLIYGKEKISEGIDFPLLRMRTGYAAFMLGNFGQSLKQYKNVLDADPTNNAALYYVYLNNLYLNNITAARYYAGKLSEETKLSEKISAFRISGVETEFSYKIPTDTTRKNAQYFRLGLNIQLGYKLQFQQSGAIYNQQVNEPRLLNVVNNQRIKVNQKEYYGKLIFAASGTVSIIGGVHYFYTPYNNFVYNNTILFAGVKYATPFMHIQAMANFGKITDTTYNQYDLTLSLFPLGNSKFYSITRAAYGNQFTLSQIAGYRATKNIWLEGHVTLGKFGNLIENDALYVYNDIDEKQFKAGGSMYALVSKKLRLSLNYTFDRKLKYKTTNQYFYQHSINGGLTWTF